MPEFLKTAFTNGPIVSPLDVALRLVLALVLGGVVAWIYGQSRSKAEIAPTFPTTLVLLSVLIAMVTQVIGDNVARAFSLVGALSIVRFRTVVRDTQDTAYVIFAVAVGMAVGAQNLWVAAIGIIVIGVASFFKQARMRGVTAAKTDFILTIRAVAGTEPEKLFGAILDRDLETRELASIGTAKQGTALDVVYLTRLHPQASADGLIRALGQIEGVLSIQFQQRGFDLD